MELKCGNYSGRIFIFEEDRNISDFSDKNDDIIDSAGNR